jgi:hypothetical protein
MHPKSRLGAVAVCGIVMGAAGCSEGPGTSDATALSSSRTAIFSGGEGVPGPWWRHGAVRDDFHVDLNTCRRRSVEARHKDSDDPPDAAYRAFLECMVEFAWKRGPPPQPPRVGPG